MKIVKKFVYYSKSIIYLDLIYSSHFKNEIVTKTIIISFLFKLNGYGK